jgi:hypothetical protein
MGALCTFTLAPQAKAMDVRVIASEAKQSKSAKSKYWIASSLRSSQ